MSFSSYLSSQLTPPDDLDFNIGKESARIRVYNTLFRVPYHLERFVWVSVLACLDVLLVRHPFQLYDFEGCYVLVDVHNFPPMSTLVVLEA